MAALYFDEHLTPLAIPLLERAGHTAARVVTHYLGAPDFVNLLFAWQQGWIMVTSDFADYLTLHDTWHHWSAASFAGPAPTGGSPEHAGILVTRYRWTKDQLTHNVGLFLALLAPQPIANRAYVWQDGPGWVSARPSLQRRNRPGRRPQRPPGPS